MPTPPLALALALTLAPAVDELPPSFDPPVLVVGEHRFERRTLGNGLRALAVREAGDAASVFMVIGAGSARDDRATTGLAHLVEHALFTGSRLVGTDEHEARVVSWGGESNAYTREDYTLYYDHGFDPGRLGEVLVLEADRLRNLTFEREPFLHERWRLEREEASTFTQAEARAELLDAAMFQAGPYAAGVRDADGHTLAPDLTLEQARAFYDQWYHPDNAAVVVVTPGEPAAALDLVEAAFAHLPVGPPTPPVAREPEQRRGGSLTFASSLPGDKLYHGWVGPARHEHDPDQRATSEPWGDRVALAVVAWALGERHRDAPGVPLEVSMGGRLHRDLFLLGSGGPEAAERLAAVRSELDERPVSADELAAAVAELGDDWDDVPVSARPYFSLAGSVGIHAVLGDPTLVRDWPARLAALTPADLAAAVDRWLDPERTVAVRFLGSGEVEAGAPLALPEDPDELSAFAQDAAEAGDTAAAIAAYERLLELGPDRMNAVIYGFYLGSLKRETGDLEGAIADLEAALEVVDYPAVRELADEIRAELAGGGAAAEGGEDGIGHEDAADGEGGDVHAAAGEHDAPADATGDHGAHPPVTSGVAVTSTGDLAPDFADEAQGVLADLEVWRGLTFERDLVVEFLAAGDAPSDKLNGWYEPDTERLVVIENDNATMGRGTMLHEMFHALQDQRFDLGALHDAARAGDPTTTGERDRALRGLIEGEAMLAVAELMDYDFEQHTDLPATGELDEARFEKVFHYGAGLRFVRALRDAGGWAQVDRAFRTPPTSTMQVLHPDRYLAGLLPEDLAGLPGPECACTEEHEPTEVLGAYGLSLWLARPEATRAASARLAGRLAGDLLHRIHDHESGAERFAWYLAFHDELAADEVRALVTGTLGLEVWDLDPSGRRLGVLVAEHPLAAPE